MRQPRSKVSDHQWYESGWGWNEYECGRCGAESIPRLPLESGRVVRGFRRRQVEGQLGSAAEWKTCPPRCVPPQPTGAEPANEGETL